MDVKIHAGTYCYILNHKRMIVNCGKKFSCEPVNAEVIYMIMKISRNISVFLCILGVMTVIVSCNHPGVKTESPNGQTIAPISVPDVIMQGKGKVVVALLGMPGCPGTEAATKFLTDYSKTKREGVKVCRIDVPLSGTPLEPVRDVAGSLEYVVDHDRKIADRLDFFFYPTLYLFDREGVARFSGECEPDKVKTMVAELLAESPGVPKKMYTQPLAKVGDVVDDFNILDSDGKTLSLTDLCGETGVILFFSSTTCPFSMEAADDLERVKKDYAAATMAYAIVSFGQPADKVRDVYQQKTPGIRLVVDVDCSISKKYFGITAVPSFCLLDKDRKVLGCGPFAYDSVKDIVANTQDQNDAGVSSRGAG